jgi:hypothetical protein
MCLRLFSLLTFSLKLQEKDVKSVVIFGAWVQVARADLPLLVTLGLAGVGEGLEVLLGSTITFLLGCE